MRPQRAFEIHPARGWVPVIQVGRGTEKTFLADFPLVGAFRQVGMRLARRPALNLWKVNVTFH
jgi:hypothetical protein